MDHEGILIWKLRIKYQESKFLQLKHAPNRRKCFTVGKNYGMLYWYSLKYQENLDDHQRYQAY
jgi:hypothetical protein